MFGLFTAARDWPEPERPNSERANRVSWGMIFLYCGLGLTAAVGVVWFLHRLYLFTVLSKKQSPEEDLRNVTAEAGSV